MRPRALEQSVVSAVVLAATACATPRLPTTNDPCAAGWRAFEHGDREVALAKYSACERATERAAPVAQPPTAEEARLAQLFGEMHLLEEESPRKECPRTTMIEEALAAVDRLAQKDTRKFRHAMAMSCVDAIIGRTAIERAIHPCALLETPPPAKEIPRVRAALEKRMPPLCVAEQSRKGGGFACAPYGDERPFPREDGW